MIDFEDKLMLLGKVDKQDTDPDNFLEAFHGFRREREKDQSRMISGMGAAMFIFLLGILTTMHLSNQSQDIMYMTQYSTESSLFDTELWDLETDVSPEHQLTYVDDITLFLLEEDDFWETMDLINDIDTYNETNKEETL
tara:strand:- start:1599 stop:2015 length:417 start_codon:yes stop_codon:yes gene_type:complete